MRLSSAKAYRVQAFREQGASILLVSHNMGVIESMCQRAAWLDHGHLMAVGDVSEVITYWQSQPG